MQDSAKFIFQKKKIKIKITFTPLCTITKLYTRIVHLVALSLLLSSSHSKCIIFTTSQVLVTFDPPSCCRVDVCTLFFLLPNLNFSIGIFVEFILRSFEIFKKVILKTATTTTNKRQQEIKTTNIYIYKYKKTNNNTRIFSYIYILFIMYLYNFLFLFLAVICLLILLFIYF